MTFTFADLNFDDTDPDFINDAFEVALVDREGNSLIRTLAAGRDAFFNISEDVPVAMGDGVDVTDGTVTVGLNEIPAGTAATLIFRLANNDSDTQTSVRVTDFELVNSDLAAVAPGEASSRTSSSAIFQASQPGEPEQADFVTAFVNSGGVLTNESEGQSAGLSISANVANAMVTAGTTVLISGHDGGTGASPRLCRATRRGAGRNHTSDRQWAAG